MREKGSAGSAAAFADAFCCEETGIASDGDAFAGKSLADTSPGVNRTVTTSKARMLFSNVQRCERNRMWAALADGQDPAVPAVRFMQ